ncbi:protein indeterminate-domain 7-like [Actinidia eriantha]|uniref:protein indeterminate-domain 7-like n=1 Tax=Actinidia eriantha TaxID=165200 RepID=UPI0025876D8D|nr:protein indeterminate-domain 7-like [Actinidia eriantha]XP_057466677.1 protein indeterminate-domain 7-like [Actinidia eriantha]
MMMNGVMLDDSMSNLTSASNEASISSSNRNEVIGGGILYPQAPNQPPPPKKKRNLPGNPDPGAEVIALSPKTLMATNRFICEICNKGFQRDQNLQLHRRGHNLPWKLKQRNKEEVVRKKVYVCPEAGCVHNDPSRALGDLTGIKKHFSRKHGEKKWKCEKCSKRYAVQSDWKAHSKICGTREYRCDCGTLFSRRDSFITHRAFCDALAEETTRSSNHLTPSPFFSSQTTPHFSLQNNFPVALKTEVQDQTHPQSFNQLPPWLAHQPNPVDLPTQLFSPRFENPNPSPHMSATALLQKAAQMGVTMSKNGSSTASETVLIRPHQLAHMSSGPASGLGLASCDDMGNGLLFGNIKAGGGGNVSVTSGCMEQVGATMMSGGGGSLPCGSGFDGSSSSVSAFEEALNGMLMNPKMDPFLETTHLRRSNEGGGGNEGLTRDFLGLRGFSHGGFPNMARFDQINNTSSSSSYGQQNQSQTPWQG